MIKIIAVLCSLSAPADCREQIVTTCLCAVLPDGRAATRRMDERASGRAFGSVALCDRQTGCQGSGQSSCW